MKYNELNVKKNKKTSRKGRGISAGQGKTAGRGTKGQKSRTGSKRKPGFEGGQTPLMQRLPKLPGFRSIRTKAETVFTGQINKIGPIIDNKILFNAGLISSEHVKAKLIYKGKVDKKLSVSLQAASEKSVSAIQKAGGTFKLIETVKRQSKEKTNKENK